MVSKLKQPRRRAEFAGPVLRVALEDQAPARVGLGDGVGAGGDRVGRDDLVQACRLAVGPLAPLAREHAERAGGEQRVGGALAQVEAHRALVEHHRLLDGLQRRLQPRRRIGPGLLVEAVLHVGGGHGVAIDEARLRVQPEGDARLVGRDQHLLREQAIHRHRLVAGQEGERLEHEEAQPGWRVALDREGIELVEAGAAVGVLQVERAALGRGRVDVVHVAVVARVLRLAEGGIAMCPDAQPRRHGSGIGRMGTAKRAGGRPAEGGKGGAAEQELAARAEHRHGAHPMTQGRRLAHVGAWGRPWRRSLPTRTRSRVPACIAVRPSPAVQTLPGSHARAQPGCGAGVGGEQRVAGGLLCRLGVEPAADRAEAGLQPREGRAVRAARIPLLQPGAQALQRALAALVEGVGLFRRQRPDLADRLLDAGLVLRRQFEQRRHVARAPLQPGRVAGARLEGLGAPAQRRGGVAALLRVLGQGRHQVVGRVALRQIGLQQRVGLGGEARIGQCPGGGRDHGLAFMAVGDVGVEPRGFGAHFGHQRRRQRWRRALLRRGVVGIGSVDAGEVHPGHERRQPVAARQGGVLLQPLQRGVEGRQQRAPVGAGLGAGGAHDRGGTVAQAVDMAARLGGVAQQRQQREPAPSGRAQCLSVDRRPATSATAASPRRHARAGRPGPVAPTPRAARPCAAIAPGRCPRNRRPAASSRWPSARRRRCVPRPPGPSPAGRQSCRRRAGRYRAPGRPRRADA